MGEATGATGSPERTLGGLVVRLEARDLLREVPVGRAALGGVLVRGIAHDSRLVRPGWVFVAVRGDHHDGHDHAAEAVSAGAISVVVEHSLPGLGVPQVLVAAARGLRSRPAPPGSRAIRATRWASWASRARTARRPRRSWSARCSRHAGLRTGLTGHHRCHRGRSEPGQPGPRHDTGGARTPGTSAPRWRMRAIAGRSSNRPPTDWPRIASARSPTTSAVHHQRHLRAPRVPRHAGGLSGRQAAPVRAARGRSGQPRQGLRQARRRQPGRPVRGTFADAAAGRRRHITRIRRGPRRPTCDRAVSVAGARRAAHHASGRRAGRTTCPHPPRGPVQRPQHARGRSGVGESLGLDPAAMRAGLAALERVPGRMQRIDQGQPFGCSWTTPTPPNALAKVLDNLAPRWRQRAAGGSSASSARRATATRTKRPMMGRVAGGALPLVVVTDEDARSEDRMAILEQIAVGAERAGPRRAAATCCSSPIGAPPSGQASPRRVRGTSWCWPARATNGPSRRPRDDRLGRGGCRAGGLAGAWLRRGPVDSVAMQQPQVEPDAACDGFGSHRRYDPGTRG